MFYSIFYTINFFKCLETPEYARNFEDFPVSTPLHACMDQYQTDGNMQFLYPEYF